MTTQKWTDQQIEAWCQEHIREVPGPDGNTRPLRMSQLHWETADRLVAIYGHKWSKLSSAALQEAEIHGLDFNEAFEGLIAWLDHNARRSL